VIGKIWHGKVVLKNEKGEVVNAGYERHGFEGSVQWRLIEDVTEPLKIHCPGCGRQKEIPMGDYICESCRAASL
jgi:hypothetical protein